MPDASFCDPGLYQEPAQRSDSEEVGIDMSPSQFLKYPKSSLEIEIERIKIEKKALLKYKHKQQKLY